MKLKKIIAAAAAAVVAVSAMAVNTFAYKATKNDDGIWTVVIKGQDGWAAATGTALSDVYGVTYHVTFTEDVLTSWAGGAIGTGSTTKSWNTQEWGTDTSKPVKADTENGTITVLYDTAPFTDADEYGQFVLQIYDNNPGVTVTSADVLGKGGTVLSDAAAPAAPAETTAAAAEDDDADVVEEEVDESGEDEAPAAAETPAETAAAPAETAAQTTAAAAADNTTTSASTGNIPAIALASVMALAGATAVVAKKRK